MATRQRLREGGGGEGAGGEGAEGEWGSEGGGEGEGESEGERSMDKGERWRNEGERWEDMGGIVMQDRWVFFPWGLAAESGAQELLVTDVKHKPLINKYP